MRGAPVEVLQRRDFGDAVGPAESHRCVAVGDRDGPGPVLEGLQSDVLGGIAAAQDQQVLSGELDRVAEVVGMQDAARERLEARVLRDVRGGEVPGRDDDVVKRLGAQHAGTGLHDSTVTVKKYYRRR